MFRLRSYQIRSVEEYEAFLRERESAPATVEKYTRFVNRFITFLSNEGRVLDKASVLDFKAMLIKEYAPAAVNVGIAANSLSHDMGKGRQSAPSTLIRMHFLSDKPKPPQQANEKGDTTM